MYDVTFTCFQDGNTARERKFGCVVKNAVSYADAVDVAETHLPDNWIPDSLECEWIPDDSELIDDVMVYVRG